MPGLAWIILNAVLVVAAIGGTIAVKRRPAPPPLQLEESEKGVDEGKNGVGATVVSANADGAELVKGLPPNSSLDELWLHTLFLPERAESEAGANGMSPEEAARAAALAAQKIEFELIGIAQIATPGKESEPVAVLRNKAVSNRNVRNVRGPNQPRGPIAPQPADGKTLTKQVFHIGEKVNETGYIVKSIDADARAVEVVRNGEVIKLTINFTSEEAMQRRNVAAQADAAKQAAVRAAIPQPTAEAPQRTTPTVGAGPAQRNGFAPRQFNGAPQPNNGAPQPNNGSQAPSSAPSQRPSTPGVAASQQASRQPPGPPGVGGVNVNVSSGNGGASDRAERIRRAIEARQAARHGQ